MCAARAAFALDIAGTIGSPVAPPQIFCDKQRRHGSTSQSSSHVCRWRSHTGSRHAAHRQQFPERRSISKNRTPRGYPTTRQGTGKHPSHAATKMKINRRQDTCAMCITGVDELRIMWPRSFGSKTMTDKVLEAVKCDGFGFRPTAPAKKTTSKNNRRLLICVLVPLLGVGLLAGIVLVSRMYFAGSRSLAAPTSSKRVSMSFAETRSSFFRESVGTRPAQVSSGDALPRVLAGSAPASRTRIAALIVVAAVVVAAAIVLIIIFGLGKHKTAPESSMTGGNDDHKDDSPIVSVRPSSLSPGAIIGIVFAGIFVGLCCVGVFAYRRRIAEQPPVEELVGYHNPEIMEGAAAASGLAIPQFTKCGGFHKGLIHAAWRHRANDRLNPQGECLVFSIKNADNETWHSLRLRSTNRYSLLELNLAFHAQQLFPTGHNESIKDLDDSKLIKTIAAFCGQPKRLSFDPEQSVSTDNTGGEISTCRVITLSLPNLGLMPEEKRDEVVKLLQAVSASQNQQIYAI